MFAGIKSVALDVHQAYQNWLEDDGAHLAASVSFYLAVSFFPLLLILISATGLLLRFSGWGQDARDRIIGVIADQTAPALGSQLEAVFSDVQQDSVAGGPLGLIALLLTSLAVFVHFDDAMDRIWNVARSERGFLGTVRNLLFNRLRAFVMLLGVGVFVVAAFIANMSFSAVATHSQQWLPLPKWVWNAGTFTAAIAINWLLFIVIYKVITKVSVRWSEAAWGALFASIMWEVGRRVLAAVVIGSKFSVYGVVGSFVAVMLWMFYATTVLFLGAEYVQVLCARCNRKQEQS